MKKSIFFQSLVAGILAALAANIYSQIHFFATQVDFSAAINPLALIGANLFISLLAGLLYALIIRLWKKGGHILFNFIYSLGSFGAVIIPIAYTHPLSQPFPELFPGLAVPMVFFPVMAWLTIDPLFKKDG